MLYHFETNFDQKSYKVRVVVVYLSGIHVFLMSLKDLKEILDLGRVILLHRNSCEFFNAYLLEHMHEKDEPINVILRLIFDLLNFYHDAG